MLGEREKDILKRIFSKKDIEELPFEMSKEILEETNIELRAIEYFALENEIVPLRYVRNIGSFTIEGQKKLLASKVMIVGLGGLGGYVLEELCRAGVGEIVVVDYDTFEETNLNRQLLATENTLEQGKADVAKKRASEINKTVVIKSFRDKIENISEIHWEGVELVFDCLDRIDPRLYLEKKAEKLKIPLVHGAVAGWYGQVGFFLPGSNWLSKIYRKHKTGIEQILGNPPFTPSLVASLMTALGISYLLGELKESTFFFFDLKAMEFEKVNL